MPFPDPAAFRRAHRNGAECAGLQHQAHDRAGRDQGPDGGSPEIGRDCPSPMAKARASQDAQTPPDGPNGCLSTNSLRKSDPRSFNHAVANQSHSFHTASAESGHSMRASIFRPSRQYFGLYAGHAIPVVFSHYRSLRTRPARPTHPSRPPVPPTHDPLSLSGFR